MSYWIPAYLANMKAYIDNPNVAGMYGRWNHPPPPGNPNAPGEGGVDLASAVGIPVYALQDGQIIAAGYWKDIGHGVVTVRCNIPGYGENDLYYQHIVLDPSIKQCTNGCTQSVKRGQKIGVVGEYGEVEIGLNANWGGVWGSNHPASWADDPRPQIKALMALGDPGKVNNNSSSGVPLTRGHFINEALLNLAGDFTYVPSENITNFMIAWTKLEGGAFTNACQFNLLNTMQDETGAVQCPGTLPGIKSYPDAATGLKAMVDALQNGLYPSLVHALTTNDEINLGFTRRAAPSFANMMAANVAGDLTMWVSGKRAPLAQSYILKIMAGAGISNASIEGGTANGGPADGPGNAGQDRLPGNASDVQPPSNPVDPNSIQNLVNNLGNLNTFFGQLSKIFSNPAGIIKVLGGALLVIAGIVLGIKSIAPGGK